jgi:hypothetical protein
LDLQFSFAQAAVGTGEFEAKSHGFFGVNGWSNKGRNESDDEDQFTHDFF